MSRYRKRIRRAAQRAIRVSARRTLSCLPCFRQSVGFKNGGALPRIRGASDPGVGGVVLLRAREQFNVARATAVIRPGPILLAASEECVLNYP